MLSGTERNGAESKYLPPQREESCSAFFGLLLYPKERFFTSFRMTGSGWYPDKRLATVAV